MRVCEYCRPHRTLANENDMHKHISTEHPYRCTLCPDSLDFSSHYTWISHYSNMHKKRCPYCDVIVGIDNRQKMIHFQQVHDYHPCTICLCCFESADELLAHYANPSIEAHPYVCNRCNKDLIHNQDFWYHWFHVHGEENLCPLCPEQVIGGLKNQLQWKEHLKTKHELVPCAKCFEVFVNQYEGELHYKDRHRVACPTCPKHFPDEQSKAKHISVNHRFACPHCPNLSFQNEPLLHDHINSAHKPDASMDSSTIADDVASCTYCPKTFATDELLRAHTNLAHKYFCTICAQFLDHSETLRYHYEFVHQVKCDMCPKVCSSEGELKLHYSVAHGVGRKQVENRYVCTICQEVSDSERALVQHYKNTHVRQFDVSPPNAGTRKYSCGD